MHAPVPELKGLLTESFEQWAVDGRSCALSGGATALIFLPALRTAKVDWSRIKVFWTDERAVPAGDPESNYGIADRMLLSPLGGKAPRTFQMRADGESLVLAAKNYDDVLARELQGRSLDLAILGVGEDGHVCSLFPGHEALGLNDVRVIDVQDAPKAPKRRLSLSMRFLLQTKHIWLIAVGARKLAVLQAALSKTQRSTPLDLVVSQQAKRVTVFTDQVIRRF